MILYENGAVPVIRSGEIDLAGRRVAVRVLPYTGDPVGPNPLFDPVEGRFVERTLSGTVICGPFEPADWAETFKRALAGPLLIVGGAAARAEEVRGSFRAAAEGARLAGRGAYLLDPPAEGLPVPLPARPDGGFAPPFVALHRWRGTGALETEALAESGIPWGVLWPVIPGWTADERFVVPFLAQTAAAGADFAVPVAPADGPEFRRSAVAARMTIDPAGAEEFFDVMHHTPWTAGLGADVVRARAAVRRAGLSDLPPRPAGAGEPPGNGLAAAILEERAADAGDEHRVSLLHAAVRWIDACGRDLSAIVREGNFSRAFPFGSDLAAEAEQVLREVPR